MVYILLPANVMGEEIARKTAFETVKCELSLNEYGLVVGFFFYISLIHFVNIALNFRHVCFGHFSVF